MTADTPDWLLSSIAEMLPGCPPVANLRMSVVAGGGNNRTFHVENDSKNYFAKWYFSAPDDPRDRARAEWEFSCFAWTHGLHSLPEPIAWNAKQGVSVFEFIEGRRLTPAEVNREHVGQALTFLTELNQFRDADDSQRLPVASEACFSVAEHMRCVRNRVERLQAGIRGPSVSPKARQYIAEQLMPAVNRVDATIRETLESTGQSASEELRHDFRVISPSDFGFHNAFVEKQGSLRFFDFEYAGWDDPAKTICDFFCQISVPAPPDCWLEFAEIVAKISGTDMVTRAQLLMPLYRIKWCCIVLNPLLQIGRKRREFSGGRDAAISEDECLNRAERVLRF
jgi:hypothetical protein